MPKSSKRLWLIGALLAAGWTVTASAQTIDPKLAASWAFMQQQMPGVSYDLLKAACAEGEIAVYHGTWSDAQRSEDDQFKKRFPCIQVRAFEMETGPRRERFLSEMRANHNITDIVQDTDPGALNDQADKGLLMDYTISTDKFYSDAVKRKGFWYPMRIGISGNAWNTTLVTPEQAKKLESWDGVIDPAWAGKVAVVEPVGGGATFLPWYYFDKTYGTPIFQKIGTLKPRFFPLNQAGAALASGDVAVVIAISETPLTTLWLQGAPIQWSLPEPGIGPATGQGISAKAPHPNAAKLFQEYSFTEEGYEYWQKLGGPPARIGYKDKRDVAGQPWYKYPKNFYQYNLADVDKDKERILDLFHGWGANAH